MNTQRINISNIVRSILLIAIGIVLGVGISIGIGIGRSGNAPSPISQKVGQFGQNVVASNLGLHTGSLKVLAEKVLVERRVGVARLGSVLVDRAAADVVGVNSGEVHGKNLLL